MILFKILTSKTHRSDAEMAIQALRKLAKEAFSEHVGIPAVIEASHLCELVIEVSGLPGRAPYFLATFFDNVIDLFEVYNKRDDEGRHFWRTIVVMPIGVPEGVFQRWRNYKGGE